MSTENEQQNTLTQADIDRATAEAAANATKELLKALGVSKIEDAQSALQKAKETQKAQMSEVERLQSENTELNTRLGSLQTDFDTATIAYKQLALDQAAIEAAAKKNVTPVKARQIVKLLEINPTEFDPAKPEALAKKFEEFLSKDENKHFVGGGEGTPETPGRKPGAQGQRSQEPSKFDRLRASMTAITSWPQ